MKEMERRTLVRVEGVHKKFCKNLKFLMMYGIVDLTKAFFNRNGTRGILRKHEFWAVKNLTVDFRENEITALLGVNGSGKTSFIRMLAGIYDVDKGDIEYNDTVQNVVSIFAIKSGLHPTLTGRENIYLKSAYYGSSEEMIDDKMDFIIEFSGIREHIDSPFGNYSSGMKTRLAMSIALSIDAEILYIDEGFSFSDPGFKMRCFDLLKERFFQKNKTLIFATHQIGKINELANRVVLMDKGEVILDTGDIDFGLKEYLKYCD